MHEFKPDDIVKSCDAIEAGCRLHPEGMGCCYKLPVMSPIIVTSNEINSPEFSHEMIVNKRRQLFEALNGLNDMDTASCKTCACLQEKKYKDVNFDYLGGCKIESSFNIAPSYSCNLRCSYCYLKETAGGHYHPATYNIIDVYEKFREKGKIKPAPWIQYNGGEPTLDKDFEKNLEYMVNYMGTVCIFSNSTNYSPLVEKYLAENKIFYETSVDAGTASTYKKIHAADAYTRVLSNIIRYVKTGTKNVFVKYIVLPENMTDDDLWGFVMAMAAIKPPHVYIASEYVCGDDFKIHPDSYKFAAKMWYMLEKYANITPYLPTDDESSDEQYVKYSQDVRAEYARLIKENPITDEFNLNKQCCCKTKKKLSLRKRLFSISKENNHKVVRVAGIKVALKTK